MIEIDHILDVELHINGLKAVVFDMDDTLYGEKEYVRSGYKQIAKILPQVQNAEEKLWSLFEAKKPAIDGLLQEEGLDSVDLKQECLKIYRFQEPEIHLYDGVANMLGRLKEQGYLLGLITDGRPEGQRAKIKSLNLEKWFDHIIVTDEFGGPEYRKPNTIAFKTMKELFG